MHPTPEGPFWAISQAITIVLLASAAFSRVTKIFQLRRNREAVRLTAAYVQRQWNDFCQSPIWNGTLSSRTERAGAWVLVALFCVLSADCFVFGLGYGMEAMVKSPHDPFAVLWVIPMFWAMWFGGSVRRAAHRLRAEIAGAVVPNI